MSKVYGIILAGGTGSRLGAEIPKQFLEIAGKPIIIHSCEKFAHHPQVDELIIVGNPHFAEKLKTILHSFEVPKIKKIISGGKSRQESAFNALTCQKFNKDDILLFHDAARPFVSAQIITENIIAAQKFKAAATYIPCQDTITIIHNQQVTELTERKFMFAAQTPQTFQFETIIAAHLFCQQHKVKNITDDASLVFNFGKEIKQVSGDSLNFKITTQQDLLIAKALFPSLS